jgi:hypothetical protein
MANVIITSPGYFWGVSVYFRVIGGQNVMANPGANHVQVCEFVIPFDMTISAVTLNVTTAVAASHINIGLYDHTKTKAFDSGQISSGTLGLQGVTGLSVSLSAGSYYLAWSCDDATNLVKCDVSNTGNNEQNKNQTRWGVAANSTAAGVMPPTLGTITAGTQSNAPITFFEA